MHKKETDYVVRKLFLSMLPLQALAEGLPAINGLLNTSIIGQSLGVNALAAIGFASPLIQVVSTIAVMISAGAQLMCARYLGEGNKEGVRQIFCSSLTLCLLFGVPLMLACLIFPEKLALLSGASQEHMLLTAEYIRGYGFGVIFSILSTTILPFLQLDKAEKNATVSVTVMILSNIGFNLLNAFWLKLGIFGAGLAMSVSCVLMVLTAATHFAFQSEIFRYSIRCFNFKSVRKILYQGVPNAVSPVCIALRNRILNQVLMSLGGAVAVSALTVGETIAWAIGMVVDGGYSSSGRIVSSVLAGERDRESLRKLPKIMISSAGYLYFVAYAIVFFFAKPLALLIGADPAYIEIFVMVIRVNNIWYLTNSVKSPAFCVLAGLGDVKMLTLSNLLNNFIFPAALIMTLGKSLGIPFVVGTAWIANILLMIIYAFRYRIQTHKWPPSILELINIPESFCVSPENMCSITGVRELDQVIDASIMINDFCRKKGLSSRISYYCSLCVEEMASNTILHGCKKGKRKDYSLDVRVIVEDGEVSIILRDDCPNFDPNKWLELCSSDDPTRGIGIRMVSKISKEMKYENTLGLNVLSIRI